MMYVYLEKPRSLKHENPSYSKTCRNAVTTYIASWCHMNLPYFNEQLHEKLYFFMMMSTVR